MGYGSINIRHCMWEKTYERFAIKKMLDIKCGVCEQREK